MKIDKNNELTVCFLTPRFPFPENGGDVLRINNIAKHFKKLNYKTILISFREKKNTILFHDNNELYDEVFFIYRSNLESFLYSFINLLTGKPIQTGYYYSPRFSNLVKSVINKSKPELFICHLLRMAPYIEKNRLTQKTILEMTDALSKTYALSEKSSSFSIKRLIYKIEKTRILTYEQKIINLFKKIILVSTSDIQYLKINCILNQEKYFNNVYCFSNGIEIPKINDVHTKNYICFIGNMRTLQNRDAVFYFIKEIFPLIKRKQENCIFKIVGAEPGWDIRKLQERQDIIVTGYVDNIIDEIKDASCMVAPIRIAAGIQNKVLLSMSAEIPVVMTSLISEGIPEIINGVNAFIADSALEIADKCCILLNNKAVRQEMKKNALEMIANNYTWEKQLYNYEK